MQMKKTPQRNQRKVRKNRAPKPPPTNSQSPGGLIKIERDAEVRKIEQKHRNALSWAIFIGVLVLLVAAGSAKILIADQSSKATAAADVFSGLLALCTGAIGTVIGYYFGNQRSRS